MIENVVYNFEAENVCKVMEVVRIEIIVSIIDTKVVKDVYED